MIYPLYTYKLLFTNCTESSVLKGAQRFANYVR